jgi:ribosomal protein S18
LSKNNRWGSRLAASKKSKKCSNLFNNNTKSIIGTRQYSKDVKKEDSVDTANNIFLKGDMRSKLHQILPNDPQGAENILNFAEQNRLDAVMAQVFDEAIKKLWAGELAKLPEDEVPADRLAEIQHNLEQRVMEIASKAPVQFMEFANGLIVDREKENKISQRIGDPNWWDWDNPYVRKSFLMSLRNNYLEAQKFLIKPGTGEIDGTRAAAKLSGDDIDQVFITPEDIAANEATGLEFEKPQRRRRECLLCSDSRHEFPLEPMNVPFLRRFMNTSGNILGRPQTGLCRKHQSKVQKTIKWAKHIGIFQYKDGFQVFNPARTTAAEAEEIEIPEWMLAPK